MNKQRDYQSPLRQEQARRTREQILDGLIQAMARGGLADLSIPAVAREAGVSVPTIYRYFHTKRELIELLGSYLVQKAGIPSVLPSPGSPEELIALVKGLFLTYEGADEMLRAAAMRELSYEMRQYTLPRRIELIEEACALSRIVLMRLRGFISAIVYLFSLQQPSYVHLKTTSTYRERKPLKQWHGLFAP